MHRREREVAANLGEPAKAAGIPYTSLADKVSIKKLWLACRKSFDTGRVRGSRTNAAEEDLAPLPVDVEKSCREGWQRKHSFVLSLGKLLVDYQLNKIWKEIHASPRIYPMIPLRRLRLAGGVSEKPTKTGGLVVRPGSAVTEETVEIEVTGTHQLWTRARAFFHSVAYLCVDQTSFFDFQSADDISEEILGWLPKKHKGGSPSSVLLLRSVGSDPDPLPGSCEKRAVAQERGCHHERVSARLDCLGCRRGGARDLGQEGPHAAPYQPVL